ncbi:ATP-binding protein [Phytohabitans kaempferiae]|uniref:ATP-binding protein n=1 Tax=Phytohabitans kaempferiae TaxID=1620943 RepID=A0ABV6M9D9_9ACTN
MDTSNSSPDNTKARPGGGQTPTPETPVIGTLTYLISPGYVQSWSPVRAMCELIANALDEDPSAHVAWADGVLTIADEGPGIPEEGLILGESFKTDEQIGQFGEGKKIGCLVLARTPQVGAIRFETVGYGFTPTVERERLLGGQLPSRSEAGAEILVYHVHRNERREGTVITIECPKDLADEAIGRFRTLTEPGYTPPWTTGVCVLDREPGRVWIGGVLVSTVPGFLASYDLPLTDKGLQNRDRTVIEAGALREAVRAILATSEDQAVIDRFATHVLAGGKLREQEQFFTSVYQPRARAAWRTWARAHLSDKTYYTSPGNEEAALDLQDMQYTQITAAGLAQHQQRAFMDLLGVHVARVKQQRHYTTRNKTTWVPDRDLTAQQRAVLNNAVELVRRAVGPFALDRVRAYSDSEESPCAQGFYDPRTGDVAVHIDLLDSRKALLATLVHEAAHRVGHRGGGPWPPIPDYGDRTRGFENLLSEFVAVLLDHAAGTGKLPDLADAPDDTPGQPVRGSGADDPAVPAIRRDLARLLADQLPHALAAKQFTDVKDLVFSTAVPPGYWRTLTRPRPAGYRQSRSSRGRAWDYDRVALLAEAIGIHPPVVWLAYNLCEGPILGGQQRPGPWRKRMRDATARACADLDALGGAYAAQVPALRNLANGTTPARFGDDTWHAPAHTLIALERQRLNLDAQTPA